MIAGYDKIFLGSSGIAKVMLGSILVYKKDGTPVPPPDPPKPKPAIVIGSIPNNIACEVASSHKIYVLDVSVGNNPDGQYAVLCTSSKPDYVQTQPPDISQTAVIIRRDHEWEASVTLTFQVFDIYSGTPVDGTEKSLSILITVKSAKPAEARFFSIECIRPEGMPDEYFAPFEAINGMYVPNGNKPGEFISDYGMRAYYQNDGCYWFTDDSSVTASSNEISGMSDENKWTVGMLSKINQIGDGMSVVDARITF